MRYKKLSNEELEKFAYPNLAAEVIETGYSICTISEWLGRGRREENDKFIRSKVFGKEDNLTYDELRVLSKLFECSADYLCDSRLTLKRGKPLAYFRHYEENRQREKEMSILLLVDKIKERLKSDDQFLGFMEKVIDADVSNMANPPEAATSQGIKQKNR